MVSRMRTRTLAAILIALLVVLAVGMSAGAHRSGGIMRRLGMAIHGSHHAPGR